MGGIVPLILGIYLYSKTALPFIYVVIGADGATMSRGRFGGLSCELWGVVYCYKVVIII